MIAAALVIPAYADEVSEDPSPEAKPTYDASGKVVSPENQMGDGDGDSDTQAKAKPDPKPVMPPEGQVPQELAKLGNGEYFSSYAFLLDKSTRTLSIWKNSENGPVFVEAHASDMGRVDGDKQVLGDKKTPEGIYFFLSTHRENALDFNEYGSQAYTMDYPNLFDRREKKTGSGIWLHAIPDTKTLYRGSRGCVVVRNEVIQSLEKYITYRRTPIIVAKKASYVPVTTYQAQQKEILQWLETWRESWEAMELEKYMAHYDETFYSTRMDWDTWKRFKEGLNKKYEYIRVQIAKPSIYFHEDEAVVRFLQGYNSDRNSDFGEKTLHLKKKADGQYKIIAENWQPVSNKHLALLGDDKKSMLQQEL